MMKKKSGPACCEIGFFLLLCNSCGGDVLVVDLFGNKDCTEDISRSQTFVLNVR